MEKCKFYKKGDCVNNKGGICQIKKSVDGLSLHCSGYWSEDKIKHLKYYAEMFSTGMKNKWSELYYIDLFSGPGKCIIREDGREINGTCMEALNLKDQFKKYIFIDSNVICIEDLKKRVGGNKGVEYYAGDCNNFIEEIIDKLSEYSLSLAIIDPDSLQFCFKSYEYLSKKKVDLIVNYPIGPVMRSVTSVLAKKLNSDTLDKFHPGWKDAVTVTKQTWGNSEETKIRNLINDYISKVEKLGYFSSRLVIPFNNIKNSMMYYLVFFTKNKKGLEFWDKKTNSLKKRNPQQSFL